MRRNEISQQQQHGGAPLLTAQSAAEWSNDADLCAAEWRAGKAAGHSSAARALADMHACDDMCVTWAGHLQGWLLQKDIACCGGRVRDDCLAVQMYVLAEALGDTDSYDALSPLKSCENVEQLLAFTDELRSQVQLTHHEAQHVLGTVFLHGTMGFTKDFDAAFALFGRAAAANYAPSQSSLVSLARKATDRSAVCHIF